MTYQDALDLIKATPLPDGWTLVPHVLRTFKYRNEWLVTALHDDVIEESWRVYDVAGAIAVAARYAWDRTPGLVVTTDGEGFVTSIENREGDPAFNGAFDKW